MTLKKDPKTGRHYIEDTEVTNPAVAVGMGFAPELGGDPSFGGLETGLELTSGSLVSVGIFTCVMSYLDTVPLVRSGQMTAGEQRSYILDRTWQSTKNSVPMVVILASVLCLFPFMGPVVGLGGLVGVGFAGFRISKGIINALSDEQKDAIKQKAAEVKAAVPGVTDQADESSSEPQPQGA